MKHDVVIIGSGLGGLECGYILARQGRSVLVLEQAAQPGGCMQTYRRNGQSLDTGFHYVGGLAEGQSLNAAFDYLGLLDLPWHRLDADGFDRVSIGGQTFAFAEGYDAFAAVLSESFPDEHEALSRYAGLLRQSSKEQFAALNPRFGDDKPAPYGLETSAWEYLNHSFSSPLLRNVLSGTSLKMELHRESLPLFTFLHGNAGFIESSWRLKGGGSLIAKKLIDGIVAQGGEIRCDARVTELKEQGGRLTEALCADGSRYESDLFISDIHPALTCQLVKESKLLRPAYRRRIGSLENTFGMFTVTLLFPPETLPYFNHNHYVYRNADVWDFYRNEASSVDGVLVSCRVPEDGSGYTRQVDLLTPMSWQQCQAWSQTQVGKRGEEYVEMKQHMAEQCIALAESVVPALGKATRVCTSTPLTWTDYTSTPQGSAYGIRKDFREPLMTMLSPRTPIQNLLLTGQSLMLHGLHGVTMTAFYTCAEVLGSESIWKIVGNK